MNNFTPNLGGTQRSATLRMARMGTLAVGGPAEEDLECKELDAWEREQGEVRSALAKLPDGVQDSVQELFRLAAIWYLELYRKPICDVMLTAKVMVHSHEIFKAYVVRLALQGANADDMCKPGEIFEFFVQRGGYMTLAEYFDGLAICTTYVNGAKCLRRTLYLAKKSHRSARDAWKFRFETETVCMKWLHMTCWVCLDLGVKWLGQGENIGCVDFFFKYFHHQVSLSCTTCGQDDLHRLEIVVLHVLGVMTCDALTTGVVGTCRLTSHPLLAKAKWKFSLVDVIWREIEATLLESETKEAKGFMMELAMLRVLNKACEGSLCGVDPKVVVEDALEHAMAKYEFVVVGKRVLQTSSAEYLEHMLKTERGWGEMIAADTRAAEALCCEQCRRKWVYDSA